MLPHVFVAVGKTINIEGKVYVPRYIVQDDGNTDFHETRDERWRDLKEFSGLEDARKYKRELELEGGIIIE